MPKEMVVFANIFPSRYITLASISPFKFVLISQCTEILSTSILDPIIKYIFSSLQVLCELDGLLLNLISAKIVLTHECQSHQIAIIRVPMLL
jgi:hypothetical protein